MVGNEGSHGAAKGVPLGLLAPPAFVTGDEVLYQGEVYIILFSLFLWPSISPGSAHLNTGARPRTPSGSSTYLYFAAGLCPVNVMSTLQQQQNFYCALAYPRVHFATPVAYVSSRCAWFVMLRPRRACGRLETAHAVLGCESRCAWFVLLCPRRGRGPLETADAVLGCESRCA